jgi:glycosyltransferase involved in cell wall biosynthesis
LGFRTRAALVGAVTASAPESELAHREPESRAAAHRQAVIWLEAEDLLRHFDIFSNPSGIQRSTREIFEEAERLFGAEGRVRFCRLSLYTSTFEAIDYAAIESAIAHPAGAYSPAAAIDRPGGIASKLPHLLPALTQLPRWLPRLAATPLRDILRGKRRQCDFESRLMPGDVILSLGSPWINARYVPRIADVKRKTGVRFAALIHDLIPVHESAIAHPHTVARFKPWLEQVIREADLLFTFSQHTRRELAAFATGAGLALPPVQVVRIGAGFRGQQMPSSGPVRSLLEGYVLYVSTIEARKNHALLLRVWRRLIERHGAERVPQLLFVGRTGWHIEELLDGLKASGNLGGKLTIACDWSDAEVKEAYRRCRFTVFPSLTEGWGSPVGESLLHGKFCVASDRASLPEVGGDFLDYFDPTNDDDAFQKIERVLFEPGYLHAREARIRDGYRSPSWAECARALVSRLS